MAKNVFFRSSGHILSNYLNYATIEDLIWWGKTNTEKAENLTQRLSEQIGALISFQHPEAGYYPVLGEIQSS